MLTAYSETAFAELNDFCIARDQAGNNLEKIPTLVTLIEEHQLQQDIAVSMLHKHFDLESGEYLLKDYESERLAFIRPQSDRRIGRVPYLWKYDPSGANGAFHFRPLEFLRVSDYSARGELLAEQLETASDFLHDLSATLVEMSIAETFGIMTLHSPVPAQNGEVWQETTDYENRVLTLRLLRDDDIDPSDDSVQTLWTAPDMRKEVVACTGHQQCTWCCHAHHCVKHHICRAHPRPVLAPEEGEEFVSE